MHASDDASSQPAASWLAAHGEQPPAALRARLDTVVASSDPAGGAVADALLQAGRALLSRILDTGSTQRDAALDLLTADALVTYAFEAAADDPATLDARAGAAMRAIAGVVQPGTR